MEYPRIIPHQDGAGVIEAVGPDVPASRVGERVWIYEAQLGRAFGTAAEFVALPAEQAVRLPDHISFSEGACLGVPAMTAHRCVFTDGPVQGQTILVAGGAGAVGHYAIQLAKWGGATVISTVSSDEKAEVARLGGADHILNYRREDIAGRILDLTEGQGLDRVVEVAFGQNLSLNLAVLKPSGVIASYASDVEPEPKLPFSALMMKNITVHFVLVYVMSKAAHQQAKEAITSCLEQGLLKHQIARHFSLTEVALAHEAVESGRMVGNVVVDVKE
jgi:NADPH2:quinone reductase